MFYSSTKSGLSRNRIVQECIDGWIFFLQQSSIITCDFYLHTNAYFMTPKLCSEIIWGLNSVGCKTLAYIIIFSCIHEKFRKKSLHLHPSYALSTIACKQHCVRNLQLPNQVQTLKGFGVGCIQPFVGLPVRVKIRNQRRANIGLEIAGRRVSRSNLMSR